MDNKDRAASDDKNLPLLPCTAGRGGNLDVSMGGLASGDPLGKIVALVLTIRLAKTTAGQELVGENAGPVVLDGTVAPGEIGRDGDFRSTGVQ